MGSMARTIPGFEQHPLAGRTIIGNLGALVEVLTNTMAYKFPHHRKSSCFNILLNRMRDIRKPVLRVNLADPFV